MMRILRDCSVAAMMLAFTSALAYAQATAQLSGRVTDESGGVLPGVSVTVIQTDTGFTRTTVTDEGGAYVLPNLPIGPYLNSFNWDPPTTNLASGQFGRLTTQEGDPRIMQFGVKYGF